MPSRIQKHWVIAALLAVVIVIIAIVVGLVAAPKSSNQTLETLQQKGAALTEADIASIDKTDLFFAFFKQANTQPITRIITESYYTAVEPGKTAQTGDTRFARDITFNYQTKQAVKQDQSYRLNEPASILAGRCYQGVRYVGSSANGTQVTAWEPHDTSNIACGDASGKIPDDKLLHLRPNDDFLSGGLSNAQAETFNRALRQSQVIEVQDAKLVKRDNSSFIRLELQLVSQKTDTGYWGVQYLLWSFQETGINSLTHPYSYLGAGGNGLRAIYYFDTSTQLPVYSIIKTTPAIDGNGQIVNGQVDTATQQVYYQFPKGLSEPSLDDKNLIARPAWFDLEKL